ncbi:MAG TPA: branched-chain amino acid ABC transporter permease [Candidatus Dormibacteraeota bacterium]
MAVSALQQTRVALRTGLATRIGTLVVAILIVALLGPKVVHFGGLFLVKILISGLAVGAVYALIAIGYTMVYGIIELINFAHGDVFTMGAFISTFFMGLFGVQEGVSSGIGLVAALIAIFLITMLLTGGINVAIERVAYRPLRNAPRLSPLITAVGMSFVLEGILNLIVGPSTHHYPDLLPDVSIPLGGGATITSKQLIVMAIAAVLVAALAMFINRSRLGKAMRATAQDRDAAQLMGIDINRTISATFFIGAALAGAGGIVYGLYNNNIQFQLGFETGLIAFTAAVLGGIGNIPGAALGGLLIGIVDQVSTGYIADTWKDVAIFSVLILILTLRPTGLLGMRVPEK